MFFLRECLGGGAFFSQHFPQFFFYEIDVVSCLLTRTVGVSIFNGLKYSQMVFNDQFSVFLFLEDLLPRQSLGIPEGMIAETHQV